MNLHCAKAHKDIEDKHHLTAERWQHKKNIGALNMFEEKISYHMPIVSRYWDGTR
jgi:hypothetical protein